jgi:hypothetical protein
MKAVRKPLPLIVDSAARISPPVLSQPVIALPDIKGFATATPHAGEREEILHRAYSIWECAGRPEHCEVAHWLEAEKEVLSEA